MGLENTGRIGQLILAASEIQGNRISDLSEDFGEESVLPSRPLDLDAQGALNRAGIVGGSNS